MPELEGNGALIKVIGCGLCGSDIVKYKQGLMKEGSVLGHEVVGEIAEIKGSDKFKKGDKIVLGHHVPCFECPYCIKGNYSMCEKFKSTNIFPGGFSEYIFASEDHIKHTAFKIPENLDLITASYTEPLSCCIRAIKRANVKKGDNVAIIGLGSIGLLMGQACAHYGANVVGYDLMKERTEIAQSLSFNKGFIFEDEETSKQKFHNEISPIGADIVFLVAGSAATLSFATKLVRNGGTICVFSSVKDYNAGFPNNEIYYRELQIMGSYSPSPDDLKESLDLLNNKYVKTDGFAVKYSLEEINEAISDTLAGKILKAYIEL